MNRILNPFESLSSERALGWGAAGVVLSLALIALVRAPFDWSNASMMIWLFSGNLLLWLPLSTMLYIFALVFSPSRIRAVDIYGMTLFALLPTILMFGVSNAITPILAHLSLEPRSVADLISSAIYNLLVICLSVSMVWSMVWGCFAYSVSANMKVERSMTVFIVCYVLVSVVIQVCRQFL